MMSASPTFRRVIAPAWKFRLQELVLCVLLAIPAGANSPFEDRAALLGAGQRDVFRAMAGQSSANAASWTWIRGIAYALLRHTPEAQEVA
jgi:alkylated DNA nucleotide flippase Atl1